VCGVHFSTPRRKLVALVTQVGKLWGALVQKSLTRFHKLSGKEGELSCHNSTNYQLSSKERVFEFQNRSKAGSQQDVRVLQNVARQQAIENNRKGLKSITETVLLCARQNIPVATEILEESCRMKTVKMNEGIFRALLRFRVRGGDDVLRKHLFEGTGNAQCISPEVQNGLLNAALMPSNQSL
jgi:hypothetical protein